MGDSLLDTSADQRGRFPAVLDRHPGLVVFGIALSIRVAYCLVSVFLLGKATLGGGAHDGYIELAQNLLAGEGYRISAGPNLFRPPAYVLFLVPWVLLPGTVAWVLGAQALLGSATCLLVVREARRFVGDRLAWLSGMGLALYPWHVHFTTNAMTPILSAALAMSLVVCWGRFRRADSPLGALACGLLFGLLALCHPSAVLVGPLLVVDVLYPILRAGRRRAHVVVCATMVCVGASLPLAPWVIRNYRSTGAPVLLSNNTGFVYFISDRMVRGAPHLWSRPPGGITPGMREAARLLRDNGIPVDDEMRVFKGAGPAQADFFNEWMKRDLFDHPEKLPRRIFMQAWWFWFGDRPSFTILHVVYKLPLLLLAVVGVWRGIRSRLPILPLVGTILAVWSVHAVLMGYLPLAGYCIVVMGPLCVLAALGLDRGAARNLRPDGQQ